MFLKSRDNFSQLFIFFTIEEITLKSVTWLNAFSSNMITSPILFFFYDRFTDAVALTLQTDRSGSSIEVGGTRSQRDRVQKRQLSIHILFHIMEIIRRNH